MREWLPVALWEIRRMLLRTDFVISTLLVPVLMVGFSWSVSWFKSRDAKRVREVAVVRLDAAGAVSRDSLPPLAGVRWIIPPAESCGTDVLAAAVRAKRWAGAVRLPADWAAGGEITVHVPREGMQWRRRVETHLTTLARLERAAGRPVGAAEFAALTDTLHVRERVAGPQRSTSRADRVAALVMAMLLVGAVFGTNMYLAIGITAEKQARVTEVIVSAISPQSWIDGKIVAYTLIGLAQPVLWTLGGLVAIPMLSWQLPPVVNPLTLSVFALYLLVGFVFFVSLYALVLATVKDLASTTKMQAYLIFLPVAPMLFIEAALESPDATWLAVLSQVPAFSPVLMPLRVAMSGAQAWEVALGLVLLAVAAWLMRKAAGTAFRVGMLMYGKELTLPELVRWSREA